MSTIKLKDRSNIKVYNTCANFVSVRGMIREFAFDAAKDGFYPVVNMSYDDIESANNRNPHLFATGILTFDESERDEIYDALHHPNWRETIWTDETIEDALTYPNKEKMDRIIAVRDVLTIDRIRGVMTKLINKGKRPIDKVVHVVNTRCNEIYTGKKVSEIVIALPDSIEKDDAEKKALKAENDKLAEQMKAMQDQIAALMAAQSNQEDKPESEPEPTPSPKKSTTRAKKTES